MIYICGGLLCLFSACSLNYNEARLAEDIAEETPETIMVNFTHTIVYDGKVWVRLEAERGETYGEKKQIVLTNVYFQEFDEEGELLNEGWADRAWFDTDSEDARLSGSISIYSVQDEAVIEAENLAWTGEGKKLAADPEDVVILKKEDGSFVEGKGFTADFRKKTLTFEAAVKGSYVWEENDN